MVFRIEVPNIKAQLFLIFGTGIFFAGTTGLITGYLSHGETSVYYTLSLIFTGMGSSMKRVEKMKVKNSKNST